MKENKNVKLKWVGLQELIVDSGAKYDNNNKFKSSYFLQLLINSSVWLI